MYEIRCRKTFSGDDATYSAKDLIDFAAAADIDLGVDLQAAVDFAAAYQARPISRDLPAERRSQLANQQSLAAESHIASVARKIEVAKVEATAKKRVAKLVGQVDKLTLDPAMSAEDAIRAGLADEWATAADADQAAKAIWKLLDAMREHGLLSPTVVEDGRHISVPILHRYRNPTAAKLSATVHAAVHAGADVGVWTAEEAQETIAEGRHLTQPDRPSGSRFL